jgi:hypothetical protein
MRGYERYIGNNEGDTLLKKNKKIYIMSMFNKTTEAY